MRCRVHTQVILPDLRIFISGPIGDIACAQAILRHRELQDSAAAARADALFWLRAAARKIRRGEWA